MQTKTIIFSLFFSAFCSTLPASAQTAPDAGKTAEANTTISITTKPYSESTKGMPGYKVEFDFLETESANSPKVAEIGQFVNADILKGLFDIREVNLIPNLSKFCTETNRGEEDCVNELYVNIEDKSVVGDIVSIQYASSFLSVASTDPWQDIQVYNFVLNPLFHINDLQSIFTDPDAMFYKIQHKVRTALLADPLNNGRPYLREDLVKKGTSNWNAFETFVFQKDGIEFILPPYEIGPYSSGVLKVTIPYAELKQDLKPFYQKALQLQ